jgi:pantoate--beta-alanine ligase
LEPVRVLIFTKIPDLQGFLKEMKVSGKSIGFVPTMGALHQGHVSLISASRTGCDITVCSIFVNPTQFNDKEDLKRYPRMPEKDLEILEKAGCDAVFLPSVEEIYPNMEKAVFNFGHLDKVLEGASRPGHFNGVAQVVKRLFEIVRPDKAFFGSKDYQQVMIVKSLVRQLGMAIKIVPCPSKRETDGLAMSSRNALLSPEERKTASVVPQIMAKAAEEARANGIIKAKELVNKIVSGQTLMKLDYFEICDADDLTPLKNLARDQHAVALIAVYVGRIRLIDNITLA